MKQAQKTRCNPQNDCFRGGKSYFTKTPMTTPVMAQHKPPTTHAIQKTGLYAGKPNSRHRPTMVARIMMIEQMPPSRLPPKRG